MTKFYSQNMQSLFDAAVATAGADHVRTDQLANQQGGGYHPSQPDDYLEVDLGGDRVLVIDWGYLVHECELDLPDDTAVGFITNQDRDQELSEPVAFLTADDLVSFIAANRT